MLKTLMQAGLLAAAVTCATASAAWAGAPSGECKDAAAACRAAYEKLDKCTKGKDGQKAETCAADRTATDSACKSSNSVCVGGSSSPSPKKSKSAHSHKTKTAQKS